MRNLLFRISYCGTNYHGYQVQQNAVTVAQVLQDAIEAVIGVREPIVGCSRTDSGVHANCYYFHMKTESRIPQDRFVIALNCRLPDDIAVLSCFEVPMDFHARYCCTGKEYVYKIWNARVKNPFLSGLAYHYPYPIDIEKIRLAASHMIGTHDFKAFCAAGGKEMDTVRTMKQITVERDGDLVEFHVSGDGFLYHMVRIMIGTFLEVSEGLIEPQNISEILEQKDRSRAGRTAPPQGLYLNRVEYGGKWFEQSE
jgi:tRNA pseudouridine38-40 synthase